MIRCLPIKQGKRTQIMMPSTNNPNKSYWVIIPIYDNNCSIKSFSLIKINSCISLNTSTSYPTSYQNYSKLLLLTLAPIKLILNCPFWGFTMATNSCILVQCYQLAKLGNNMFLTPLVYAYFDIYTTSPKPGKRRRENMFVYVSALVSSMYGFQQPNSIQCPVVFKNS